MSAAPCVCMVEGKLRCGVHGAITPEKRAAARRWARGPQPTVRVIVCGSRRWNDRKAIADKLIAIVEDYGWTFPDPVIVHGGARGADRLAEEEAGKAGLLTEPHDYRPFIGRLDEHGHVITAKRAPLERNKHMAALGADLCIAFWDGRSTGTAHMLEQAAARRIPVEVVTT